MYTDTEVEYLRKRYLEAEDKQIILDTLSKELSKSKRSIIGKLSREGIYEKKVYVNKRGEMPVTKKELVANLAEVLETELFRLEGLEKAPKEVLKHIIELSRA